MVLVIIFIIAVIMYRVLIAIPLFQNNDLRSKAMMIASGSAAVVNLILIMALGKVYEKLALKLTQWGKDYNFGLAVQAYKTHSICSHPSNLTPLIFLAHLVNQPKNLKQSCFVRRASSLKSLSLASSVHTSPPVSLIHAHQIFSDSDL